MATSGIASNYPRSLLSPAQEFSFERRGVTLPSADIGFMNLHSNGKAFSHALVMSLDSQLRVALFDQPVFALSVALNTSAKLHEQYKYYRHVKASSKCPTCGIVGLHFHQDAAGY